jgi:hypothetical protein
VIFATGVATDGLTPTLAIRNVRVVVRNGVSYWTSPVFGSQ